MCYFRKLEPLDISTKEPAMVMCHILIIKCSTMVLQYINLLYIYIFKYMQMMFIITLYGAMWRSWWSSPSVRGMFASATLSILHETMFDTQYLSQLIVKIFLHCNFHISKSHLYTFLPIFLTINSSGLVEHSFLTDTKIMSLVQPHIIFVRVLLRFHGGPIA